MRRSVLLGLPLLLLVASCAGTGATPGAPNPTADPSTAFERRAAEVAQAWRTAAGGQAWRTGFVPLQDPTVLPAEPRFTEETKQAYGAGWYRTARPLPSQTPAGGTVRFPDGSTLSVPLVSAAAAYGWLDQGDAPPCQQPAAAPAPAGTGPDGSVAHSVPSTCLTLLVTGATLGTVKLRTTRGEATVPAWLFTVRELGAVVARVAVAPSAVGARPTLQLPDTTHTPGLVTAQDLQEVDGANLTYRLGVGACDKNITPLVAEYDDVVVVGGAVTPPEGGCTDQLLLHPVTVTLKEPLGSQPVLDALTGQVLTLTVR
ncbi:MAG TPA: hypothetical protein VFR67_24805 [Pilimelia sp.]|nr:hypothetical protein [Pilimelia sp.]